MQSRWGPPDLRDLVSPSNLRVYAIAVVAAGAVFKLTARPDAKLSGLVLAALLAGLVLPVLARRPTLVVCALLVIFPLQVPVLAFLFEHGIPAGLVRRLGALKDLMGLALVLRAYQDRHVRRFTQSDFWIMGYLSIASLYLVLPVVVHSLAPLPLSQRGLAWRIDCFFVVVFLALRRIDPRAIDLGKVRGTVLLMSALVAGIAVYEYYNPDSWKAFFYTKLGVEQYSAQVLSSAVTPDAFIRRGINGTVRAKSLISDPVFCGFYLLPGLLLALTRISAGKWIRSSVLLVVIGAGLLATSTRAAVLVGAVGAVLASTLVLRSGRKAARYLAPVVAVMVLVLPVVASGTPVIQRFTSALAGQDQSAKDHNNDFSVGYAHAKEHPLGAGLGTGAGVGQRFDVEGTTVSENAYLQVANELGVIALIFFVGFLVSLALQLRAQGRQESDERFLDRTAALALLFAMILGGGFQQVWYDFAVSSLVAVVLALPGLARRERELDATSTRDVQLVRV